LDLNDQIAHHAHFLVLVFQCMCSIAAEIGVVNRCAYATLVVVKGFAIVELRAFEEQHDHKDR
jgi:hypothetical protein